MKIIGSKFTTNDGVKHDVKFEVVKSHGVLDVGYYRFGKREELGLYEVYRPCQIKIKCHPYDYLISMDEERLQVFYGEEKPIDIDTDLLFEFIVSREKTYKKIS